MIQAIDESEVALEADPPFRLETQSLTKANQKQLRQLN